MTPEELQIKYAHLRNETNLRVWGWELVRRNRKYHQYFDVLKAALPQYTVKIKNKDSISLNLRTIRVKTDHGVVDGLLQDIENTFGIKPILLEHIPDPKETYCTKNIDGTKYLVGIPNHLYGYHEITPHPIVKVSSAVSIAPKPKLLTTLTSTAQHNQYCVDTLERLAPSGLDKTVFLGISTTARREDIDEVIDALYRDGSIKREKAMDVNKVFTGWYLYLAAYDLYDRYKLLNNDRKKQRLAPYKKNDIYAFIAVQINKAFSVDYKPDTIRKNVDKAKELIIEKYRYYLSF